MIDTSRYNEMKQGNHWKVVKDSAGNPILQKNVYSKDTGKVESVVTEKIDLATLKAELETIKKNKQSHEAMIADIEGTEKPKAKTAK